MIWSYATFLFAMNMIVCALKEIILKVGDINELEIVLSNNFFCIYRPPSNTSSVYCIAAKNKALDETIGEMRGISHTSSSEASRHGMELKQVIRLDTVVSGRGETFALHIHLFFTNISCTLATFSFPSGYSNTERF